MQSSLIRNIADRSSGIHQQIERISAVSGIEMLAWLEQASETPLFYWQNRDKTLEVAAFGSMQSFTDVDSASQFIQRYDGNHFQPILLGGVPFPGNRTQQEKEVSPFFFLPRQCLIRRGSKTYFFQHFKAGEYPAQVKIEVPGKSFYAQLFPKIKLQNRKDTPSYPQWKSLVEQVVEPLSLRQIPKVVLARKTRYSLDQSISYCKLLAHWKSLEPGTIPFLFKPHATAGCFLGCTPERLFRREGRELYTEALAGTLPNLSESIYSEPMKVASELRSNVKIRRENFFVQDFIKSKLDPLSRLIDIEAGTDVIHLKHVSHLKKTINAELQTKVRDSDLISALHPTPAVGGMPRKAALTKISQSESFNRQWYAGAIGYMSADESEFCVAIRSANVQEGFVELFAGAGIVAGSNPAKEWDELENKLESALSCFHV